MGVPTMRGGFVQAFKILVVLVVFVLSFSAGALYQQRQQLREEKRLAERSSHYDLLARRILVDNPSEIAIDFRILQTGLETYIAQNGLGDKASLYFEYLPTGSSIGLNEDKVQVGASLLKLPLSVAVFKAAEQGKVNLDEKVALKQEWLNNGYGDLYKRGEGYRISVREALSYALSKSDNTAALMLFNVVSRAQGTDRPNLLGFIDANYKETNTHEVLIDSRSYASILKCLYFSCFLNKDNSQEVLKYLADSESHERLELYMPTPHPRVAHKIGVFNEQTQSDCGIVYVPKRNYVLCIMVDGKDPQASKEIGRLSEIVYNYVSKIDN